MKQASSTVRRLVFAWVALAMVLATVGGLLLHTRSVWVPALSDLFLSMRYGISGRSRYGRQKDTTDELGLIRLEAGNGHAGVSDMLEPRSNGRAGKPGASPYGSEWSVTDEGSPTNGRNVERDLGISGAASEPTFVATFAGSDRDAPSRASENKQ